MNQIAQLSEGEIEERFHITGPRVVALTLAGYARDAVQFSVQFGDEMFVTTLLAVLAERRLLVFECSGAASLNQRLLQAGQCTLSGRPDGVQVHFSGAPVSELRHEGRPAIAVPLPGFIVRLQRRDSFRIATPRANPLRFIGRTPEGAAVELPAFDISVTGIGLLAAAPPEQLLPGMVLERCRFRLPDDAQDVQVSARVQHITEKEVRNGVHQWRVGLHFLNPPASVENRLQRYIARLERERHELG